MTYDANGNLTNDGTNTYVWDRANRLLNVGSSSYAYDGMNNRVQQTVGGTATKYLLDLQLGLTQVLAATTGGSTDRYVHGLRGIHAMKNNAGAWIWPTQDGLGNVRQEVSDGLAVNGMRDYEPYLTPFDEQGSFGMPFGATGEMTDVTGQVYLRNRYYNPNFGLFSSLDPFEGVQDRAMSLNGYSWVEGNVPNAVDPTGEQCSDPYSLCQTIANQKQPCLLRDSNAKTVLTVTASREGISGDEHSWAALMLMQINAFNLPDPVTGIVNRWRTLGEYDHSAFLGLSLPFQGVTPRMETLAGLLINGYCSSGDPFAFFYSSNVEIRSAVRFVFQSIVPYLDSSSSGIGLHALGQNPEYAFEVSFDTTRLERLQNDINNGRYDNPYILQGTPRSVLVGKSSITDLEIFYQCASDETAVLKPNVDPKMKGKRKDRDFECTRCDTETRVWYFSKNWAAAEPVIEILSNTEFLERFRKGEGAGFVKSCTPKP